MVDPGESGSVDGNAEPATTFAAHLDGVGNHGAQRLLLQRVLLLAGEVSAVDQYSSRHRHGLRALSDSRNDLIDIPAGNEVIAVRQEAAEAVAGAEGKAEGVNEAKGGAEVGGVAGIGGGEVEEAVFGGGVGGGGAAAGAVVEVRRMGVGVGVGGDMVGNMGKGEGQRWERGEAGGAVRKKEGVVEGRGERGERRSYVFASPHVFARPHLHSYFLSH